MDLTFNLNLNMDASPLNGPITTQVSVALTNEQRSQYRDFSTTLTSGSALWEVPFYGLTTVSEFVLTSSTQLIVYLDGNIQGFKTTNLCLTGMVLTGVKLSNISGLAADVRIILMEA